jgi:hypothetical protein
MLFVTAVMLLMPGLHGILAAGVPVYGVLLITMIWRATARVQFFEVSSTMHCGALVMIMLMIINKEGGCTEVDSIRNDKV